ncbi:ATP-binding cassette domain-containing protein, partial [Streptomyces sp. NPDC005180]|uniref:ATP-binding cassette domain-containing protein n=1 Tax=Streptomyces sp. NPDC005180 TaxID=3156868 RepID=UPI0033A8AE34
MRMSEATVSASERELFGGPLRYDLGWAEHERAWLDLTMLSAVRAMPRLVGGTLRRAWRADRPALVAVAVSEVGQGSGWTGARRRRMTDAIVVEGLHKGFGGRQALDGLDLVVGSGMVHGVLGPNGAGKTTAVRIMATLLRQDAGVVRVAGHDVRTQAAEVRRRIGLLGQHAAVDEELGGRQNLEMFGRLHHLGARRAGTRADELLERFGLADTGRKAVKRYSG